MSDVLDRLRAALADRYTVERELGSGGMAVVYLAQDLRHERRVAIKVLRPELTSVVAAERFLREIKLTAALAHPHVLPLLDSGKADGLLYYVMPYVEGQSLRSRLDREKQLPVDEALHIAHEVAQALSYAHSHNVLHRDIKPENILLVAEHAVVADFGIAKAVTVARGQKLTDTGVSVGTPAYMSPEQASGDAEIDERSDVYSLACVLYEMLGGEVPHAGRSQREIFAKRILGELRSIRSVRPNVRPELEQVLNRALAVNATDRYSTAREFARALAEPGLRAETEAVTGILRAAELRKLLHEIHRRSLWQVLLVYCGGALIAYGAVQVMTNVLGLPDWFPRLAVVLFLVLLPVVMATAFVQGGGPLVSRYDLIAEVAEGVPRGMRRVLTWRRTTVGGLAAFGLLGIAVSGYMGMRLMGIGPLGSLIAQGRLEERERIILADFADQSGDSTLAWAVTEAIRVGLSQSRVIRVADPEYVTGVLRRMDRVLDAPPDYDLAREVAIREGLKAVIAGEVTPVGSGYLISARLVAVETGDVLWTDLETVGNEDGIIPAVGHLSKSLRERAGENLSSIRRSKPLPRVTTQSLDALRKYTQAWRIRRTGDRPRAIALVQEAVALDTTFAMAFHTLSVYADRDHPALAAEALATAYRLRDRLTDPERYRVEFLYHWATGDLDRASVAVRNWQDAAGDDPEPLYNLMVTHAWRYEYAQAEQLERQYHRKLRERGEPVFPGNLVELQVFQGKFEEATTALDSASWPIRPGEHGGYRSYYASLLASCQGQYEVAETLAHRHLQEQANADVSPYMNPRSLGFALLASLAAVRGRFREAVVRQHEVMAELERVEQAGGRWLYFNMGVAPLARLEALRGAPQRGLALVETTLESHPLDSMPPLDRPYLVLAEVYLHLGRPAQARVMLAGYDSAGPRLTRPGIQSRRRFLAGLLAFHEGRVDDALAEFRSYEQLPGWGPNILAVPYVAQANELLGEADSALAMYERYLNTPWLRRLEYPGGDQYYRARIYERLGDLYDQHGDTAKAIDYYAKFVELWQAADPELQPQVEAARRAIEALTQPTD